MKKLLILSTFILVANSCLHAQNTRHEVRIGYGGGTTSDIIDAFSTGIVTALSGGRFNKDNEKNTGAIHLSYKYLPGRRFTIGGTFVYQQLSADTRSGTEKTGSVKTNHYTLAAEMDYRYINHPSFLLYSGAGLGFTSLSEKYTPLTGAKETGNETHFNYQFILLGTRVGNQVGGFAELGFGYKGIFCLGVFARF